MAVWSFDGGPIAAHFLECGQEFLAAFTLS